MVGPVVTDYTEEARLDTLSGAPLQQHRLASWMLYVLSNLFADPGNIKDERIVRLLHLDEANVHEKLFRLDLPYSPDTRRACSTPQILVSTGATAYPVKNLITGVNRSLSPVSVPHSTGTRYKTIALNIAVVTESYKGTMTLTGLIEEFLLMNEYHFVQDNGSLADFHVTGVSAPSIIGVDAAANAKPVYQQVISASASGSISWISDTQGPVFRGIETTLVVE